jgi:hypothetical protein
MTTATDTAPPASTSSPGAGPSPEENKAALGVTVAGFLLGGPLGGILMAMAIGIDRAFGNSPWEKPGSSRAQLTPEQRAAQREQAIRDAEQSLADYRERAAARQADWDAHRQRVKEWVAQGREGDRPGRPDRRSPAEFLGEAARASSSWYKLLDDKLAKGNLKVNEFYAAVGEFFRNVANFVSDFFEGYREERQRQRDEAEGDRPDPDQETGRDSEPEYFWSWDDEDPTPEPLPEPLPVDGDDERQPLPGDDDERHPVPGAEDPQPQLPPNEPVAEPAGTTSEPPIEGEVMTADGSPVPTRPAEGAAPEHMGPQGTTYLDLLFRAFAPAGPLLASTAEQVADLNAQVPTPLQRVDRIAAIAGTRGAPPAVYQMIDVARAALIALQAGGTNLAVSTEHAQELTAAALNGLRPAQANQGDTHSQGASGDMFDRASA